MKQRNRWKRKRERNLKAKACKRARDRDYELAQKRKALAGTFQDIGVHGPGTQKKDTKTGIWRWL